MQVKSVETKVQLMYTKVCSLVARFKVLLDF